ncbi:phage tail tape measure protein [Mediterraneibacter gnavus]|uniref:phage tail tape measure protein n=1 Tax=Mediterraneibacter gnavus TaxID=33038 RepID=UPI00191FD941|nr:phage tail tape measure protein [Mediterraneibacter gnavus]
MADGKVVIETDLDSSGMEKGLKKSEKSMKAQAASMAAEYRKQGMSASDAFKKAWSEIERGSSASASTAKREFSEMGQSAEQAASHAEREWKSSSTGIGSAISKIGSLASKGLKVATVAITGTAAALGGVAAAAIKVGSDFESQMSRVKAISGATGEEFEQLKAQAMQLGADTSFSASQAAEGMENLAAAGFTTSEIMSAMPGLLNLAAASGEDLASSSDIAASTLRGFGLAASDAAHVADVLAANANRTNSSVADTGEAMKYIAPLARAAGLSLEETAAAIGIMANAGIQGSQAGTSLRGALSRLSKPTDDMAAAMDELGISFYDSNGKMKSLTEQVGMLRQATEGMTDEQKNNYLVTLYGQEALSGMLALINEGEGSLGELTEAYRSCDGEAQKAAETMQDNLSGALEQLSGSAETLGLAFYNSVANNLKNAANTATESINNITDSFNNGGLNEAIQTAGDEFANLAVEAASHAPEMVDTAVDFIEAFASGIALNKGRILGAAGEMAESMASGLAELLPSKLQEPVEDAIDAVAESLSDGGLREAGETAVDTLSNVVDAVGNLADKALPPLTKALDFAGENLDLIAASATAAFTAFKGYKVVNETTSILKKGVKTWKTASAAVDAYYAAQLLAMESGVATNATLTAGQAVVGMFTGKVNLATKAQTLWNVAMKANPIGLVISAVAALAAGLGVYALTQKEAESATDKANKKLAEQAEAIRETQAARQDEVAGIQTQFGYYQQLWDELQGIVDQNGKIKEGYEERAAFITSTLSEALGVEIETTDGVIQKYGELTQSIDQVIQKKKAEAILSAYEDDYTTAIKNQTQAAKEVSRTFDDYSEALRASEEATRKLEDATASMTTEQAAGSFEIMRLQQAQMEADAELLEAEKAFDNAKTASNEYLTTISNYEAAMGAVESGSENAALSVLALANDMKRAGEASEEALKEQAESFLQSYDDMRAAAAEKGSGVTNEMVTQARIMWLMAQIEYEKGSTNNIASIEAYQNEINQLLGNSGNPEAAAQEAKETTEAATNALQEGKEPVKQAAKDTIEGGVSEGAAEADTSTVPAQKGKEAADSTANSVNSGKTAINEAAKSAVNEINTGASTTDTTTVPSSKGSEATQSLIDALHANSNAVLTAAASLGGQIPQGLNGMDMLSATAGFGNNVGFGLSSSLSGQAPVVQAAASGLENAALSGLSSANVSGQAQAMGSQIANALANGIVGGSGSVNAAASTLGGNAAVALSNVKLSEKGKQEGKKLGDGLKSGIDSGKKNVESSSKSLGDGAVSGLKGVGMKSEAYDQGLNFSYGLANGISAGSSAAISAAIAVASSALAAAKRELDERSPSKKTREFGQFFSKGLALGIKDEEKSVVKSSRNISNAALESIDLSAVSARMREVMAFNASRVANRPATSVMQYKMDNAEIRKLQQQNQAIMSAVAGLSDLAKRPIEVSTTLNGRELIKETAAPMLTEQQRITDFKKLLKGERT